jgi:hypothetical protein
MQIQPGDPVTAELLQTIINNIYTISKGEAASAVSIASSGSGSSVQVSTTAVSDIIQGISIDPATSATKYSTYDFKSKLGFTFVNPPRIAIQMSRNSTTATATAWRYHPVVANVTTAGFAYGFIPGQGATKQSNTSIHVLIIGEINKA